MTGPRRALRPLRRRASAVFRPVTERALQSEVRTRADLWLSKLPDRHHVDTVCLLVGPYRNLTTLTATVLALHPHCQVLNHGGDRVLGRPGVDFIDDYSPERLARFVRYAIRISGGGLAGWWGGSITKSHAFRRPAPAKLYAERYGRRLVKQDVRAVLWKESMVVTNRFRSGGVDIDRLLDEAPSLRLLLPIRSPLDCARSNERTGHVAHLAPQQSGTDGTVNAILDGVAWFADLRDRHPSQCLWFTEQELGDDLLRRLADFLGLDPDERWVRDGATCLQLDSAYEHAPELVARYRDAVERRFGSRPELRDALLASAPAAAAGAT